MRTTLLITTRKQPDECAPGVYVGTRVRIPGVCVGASAFSVVEGKLAARGAGARHDTAQRDRLWASSRRAIRVRRSRDPAPRAVSRD
jgi:hypothetical protein